MERATQAEVNTGTDDSRYVSPKKLKAWGAAFVRNASESVKGFIEIATQAEVDAGTDNTRAVTPKKLKHGFSILLGPNGYFIFPSFFHGWIIQWGVFNFAGSIEKQVFFTTSFTEGCYGVIPIQHSNVVGGAFSYLSEAGVYAIPRLTDVKISSNIVTTNGCFWLAWGK